MLTSTDHKLPALARATDGRAMGVTLSAALGLKGTVHVRPEMLKHAPGKRAVLAYTLSGHGAQHLRIVGKLYRDDRGARAFELLWAVWQAARSTARGRLELPEPIAYLPELGMVVQGAVAGRPLAHFGPADPNTPAHHHDSELAVGAQAISHGEQAGAVGDEHHPVKRRGVSARRGV